MAETADGETYLTPSALAKRWGVSPNKILAWIHAGQLRAVNFATRQDGVRPRYRIAPDAMREFNERRETKPAPITEPSRPTYQGPTFV